MTRDIFKADVAGDFNAEEAEAKPAESIVLAIPSDLTLPQGQASSQAQDVAVLQSQSEHAIETLSALQNQALSALQIQALSALQIQALSALQIQALSTSQIQALNKAQIQALSLKQINAMTVEQIAALTLVQMGYFTHEQLAAFTRKQAAAVSSDPFKLFVASQARRKKKSPFTLLAQAVVQSAAAQQKIGDVMNNIGEVLNNRDDSTVALSLNILQEEQAPASLLSGISDVVDLPEGSPLVPAKATNAALEPSEVKSNLFKNQYNAVQVSSDNVGSEVAVGVMSTRQMSVQSTTQAEQITQEMQALSPSDLQALTNTQINNFQISQIAALAEQQVQSLRSEQIWQISAGTTVLDGRVDDNAAIAGLGKHIAILRDLDLIGLSKEQYDALKAGAVAQHVTKDAIKSKPSALGYLDITSLQAVSVQDLRSIRPAVIRQLSSNQLNNLLYPQSKLLQESNPQTGALTPAQMEQLPSSNTQIASVLNKIDPDPTRRLCALFSLYTDGKSNDYFADGTLTGSHTYLGWKDAHVLMRDEVIPMVLSDWGKNEIQQISSSTDPITFSDSRSSTHGMSVLSTLLDTFGVSALNNSLFSPSLLGYFTAAQLNSIRTETTDGRDLFAALCSDAANLKQDASHTKIVGTYFDLAAVSGLDDAHFTKWEATWTGTASTAPTNRLTVAFLNSLAKDNLNIIARLSTNATQWIDAAKVNDLDIGVINSFTWTQWNAMPQLVVTALSPEQVGEISANAFGNFDVNHLALLSPQQWEKVSANQLLKLSITQWESLSASSKQQLLKRGADAFSANVIGVFTSTDIASLDASSFAYLTAEQVGGLHARQISSLSVAQLSAISASGIGVLGKYNDLLNAFTPEQWRAFTPAQYANIRIEAQKAPDTSQTFNAKGLPAFQDNCDLSNLTSIQLAVIPAQVLAQRSSLASLTRLQCLGLTFEQYHTISSDQRAQLQVRSLVGLDSSNADDLRVIQSITAHELSQLSIDALGLMSIGTFRALSANQLQQMDAHSVAVLLEVFKFHHEDFIATDFSRFTQNQLSEVSDDLFIQSSGQERQLMLASENFTERQKTLIRNVINGIDTAAFTAFRNGDIAGVAIRLFSLTNYYMCAVTLERVAFDRSTLLDVEARFRFAYQQSDQDLLNFERDNPVAPTDAEALRSYLEEQRQLQIKAQDASFELQQFYLTQTEGVQARNRVELKGKLYKSYSDFSQAIRHLASLGNFGSSVYSFWGASRTTDKDAAADMAARGLYHGWRAVTPWINTWSKAYEKSVIKFYAALQSAILEHNQELQNGNQLQVPTTFQEYAVVWGALSDAAKRAIEAATTSERVLAFGTESGVKAVWNWFSQFFIPDQQAEILNFDAIVPDAEVVANARQIDEQMRRISTYPSEFEEFRSNYNPIARLLNRVVGTPAGPNGATSRGWVGAFVYLPSLNNILMSGTMMAWPIAQLSRTIQDPTIPNDLRAGLYFTNLVSLSSSAVLVWGYLDQGRYGAHVPTRTSLRWYQRFSVANQFYAFSQLGTLLINDAHLWRAADTIENKLAFYGDLANGALMQSCALLYWTSLNALSLPCTVFMQVIQANWRSIGRSYDLKELAGILRDKGFRTEADLVRDLSDHYFNDGMPIAGWFISDPNLIAANLDKVKEKLQHILTDEQKVLLHSLTPTSLPTALPSFPSSLSPTSAPSFQKNSTSPIGRRRLDTDPLGDDPALADAISHDLYRDNVNIDNYNSGPSAVAGPMRHIGSMRMLIGRVSHLNDYLLPYEYSGGSQNRTLNFWGDWTFIAAADGQTCAIPIVQVDANFEVDADGKKTGGVTAEVSINDLDSFLKAGEDGSGSMQYLSIDQEDGFIGRLNIHGEESLVQHLVRVSASNVTFSSGVGGNSFYVDADKATNFSVVGMKTPFTDDYGNTNPGFYLDQVFYSSAGTATINLDKTTNVGLVSVDAKYSKISGSLAGQSLMVRSGTATVNLSGNSAVVGVGGRGNTVSLSGYGSKLLSTFGLQVHAGLSDGLYDGGTRGVTFVGATHVPDISHAQTLDFSLSSQALYLDIKDPAGNTESTAEGVNDGKAGFIADRVRFKNFNVIAGSNNGDYIKLTDTSTAYALQLGVGDDYVYLCRAKVVAPDSRGFTQEQLGVHISTSGSDHIWLKDHSKANIVSDVNGTLTLDISGGSNLEDLTLSGNRDQVEFGADAASGFEIGAIQGTHTIHFDNKQSGIIYLLSGPSFGTGCAVSDTQLHDELTVVDHVLRVNAALTTSGSDELQFRLDGGFDSWRFDVTNGILNLSNNNAAVTKHLLHYTVNGGVQLNNNASLECVKFVDVATASGITHLEALAFGGVSLAQMLSATQYFSGATDYSLADIIDQYIYHQLNNGAIMYARTDQDITAANTDAVYFLNKTGVGVSRNLYGTHNVIFMEANTSTHLNVYGDNNEIRGNYGNAVYLFSPSLATGAVRATICGGGQVYLTREVDHAGAIELTLNTNGTEVRCSSTYINATIHDTQGNSKIYGGDGFSASVDGFGTCIYLNDDSGSSLSLRGKGYFVSGDTGSNTVRLIGVGSNAIVDGSVTLTEDEQSVNVMGNPFVAERSVVTLANNLAIAYVSGQSVRVVDAVDSTSSGTITVFGYLSDVYVNTRHDLILDASSSKVFLGAASSPASKRNVTITDNASGSSLFVFGYADQISFDGVVHDVTIFGNADITATPGSTFVVQGDNFSVNGVCYRTSSGTTAITGPRKYVFMVASDGTIISPTGNGFVTDASGTNIFALETNAFTIPANSSQWLIYAKEGLESTITASIPLPRTAPVSAKVILEKNTHTKISVSGIGFIVEGVSGNNTVTLTGDGSSATVDGAVTLRGANQSVSWSAGATSKVVTLGSGALNASASGTGITVTGITATRTFTLTGDASSATVDGAVTLSGADQSVSWSTGATSKVVTLIENASRASASGTGITVTGITTTRTFTLTGANSTATVDGAVTLSGANQSVSWSEHPRSKVVTLGENASRASASGTGITVIGSDKGFTLTGDRSTATVDGAVTLSGADQSVSWSEHPTSKAVTLVDGASNATVIGAGVTVTDNTTRGVTVINAGATFSGTVTGKSSSTSSTNHTKLVLSAITPIYDTSGVGGTYSSISVSGKDLEVTYIDNNTVTLTGDGSSATVDGAVTLSGADQSVSWSARPTSKVVTLGENASRASASGTGITVTGIVSKGFTLTGDRSTATVDGAVTLSGADQSVSWSANPTSKAVTLGNGASRASASGTGITVIGSDKGFTLTGDRSSATVDGAVTLSGRNQSVSWSRDDAIKNVTLGENASNASASGTGITVTGIVSKGFTLTGDRSTATVDGAVTLSGADQSVSWSANPTSKAVTLGNGASRASASGTGITVIGSDKGFTLTGDGSTATVDGAVTLSGRNQSVSLIGNAANKTVTLGENASNASASGTGITVTGIRSKGFTLTGDRSTATVDGAVTLSGADQSVSWSANPTSKAVTLVDGASRASASGTGITVTGITATRTFTLTGANSTATVDGAVTLSGADQSVSWSARPTSKVVTLVNGASNATVTGADVTVTDNTTSGVTVINAGATFSGTVTGKSSSTSSTNHTKLVLSAITTSGGTYSSISVSGKDLEVTGIGYHTVTLTGDGSTATVDGAVTLRGANQSVSWSARPTSKVVTLVNGASNATVTGADVTVTDNTRNTGVTVINAGATFSGTVTGRFINTSNDNHTKLKLENISTTNSQSGNNFSPSLIDVSGQNLEITGINSHIYVTLTGANSSATVDGAVTLSGANQSVSWGTGATNKVVTLGENASNASASGIGITVIGSGKGFTLTGTNSTATVDSNVTLNGANQNVRYQSANMGTVTLGDDALNASAGGLRPFQVLHIGNKGFTLTGANSCALVDGAVTLSGADQTVSWTPGATSKVVTLVNGASNATVTGADVTVTDNTTTSGETVINAGATFSGTVTGRSSSASSTNHTKLVLSAITTSGGTYSSISVSGKDLEVTGIGNNTVTLTGANSSATVDGAVTLSGADQSVSWSARPTSKVVTLVNGASNASASGTGMTVTGITATRTFTLTGDGSSATVDSAVTLRGTNQRVSWSANAANKTVTLVDGASNASASGTGITVTGITATRTFTLTGDASSATVDGAVTLSGANQTISFTRNGNPHVLTINVPSPESTINIHNGNNITLKNTENVPDTYHTIWARDNYENKNFAGIDGSNIDLHVDKYQANALAYKQMIGFGYYERDGLVVNGKHNRIELNYDQEESALITLKENSSLLLHMNSDRPENDHGYRETVGTVAEIEMKAGATLTYQLGQARNDCLTIHVSGDNCKVSIEGVGQEFQLQNGHTYLCTNNGVAENGFHGNTGKTDWLAKQQVPVLDAPLMSSASSSLQLISAAANFTSGVDITGAALTGSALLVANDPGALQPQSMLALQKVA